MVVNMQDVNKKGKTFYGQIFDFLNSGNRFSAGNL